MAWALAVILYSNRHVEDMGGTTVCGHKDKTITSSEAVDYKSLECVEGTMAHRDPSGNAAIRQFILPSQAKRVFSCLLVCIKYACRHRSTALEMCALTAVCMDHQRILILVQCLCLCSNKCMNLET